MDVDADYLKNAGDRVQLYAYTKIHRWMDFDLCSDDGREFGLDSGTERDHCRETVGAMKGDYSLGLNQSCKRARPLQGWRLATRNGAPPLKGRALRVIVFQ